MKFTVRLAVRELDDVAVVRHHAGDEPGDVDLLQGRVGAQPRVSQLRHRELHLRGEHARRRGALGR